jgi:hypothetical protein
VRGIAIVVAVGASACGPGARVAAPRGDGAPVIDRFSARAGHLMRRDANPALPGPDQPIDFTRAPFLTQGLGPDGAVVRYVNLDVQPDAPAILYRFVRAGTHDPIAGQDDVVDVIPGDDGYSDFWRIAYVDVPDGFVAGSIASAGELRARGLRATPSADVIDCAVVPRGTRAPETRGVAPVEVHGLRYRGAAIACLRFGAPLALDGGRVPTSPIFVTFARPAVFRTEPGAAAQTHNVVMSVPGDVDYSPLWAVHVYDPAAFDRVRDAETASRAPLVDPNGPHVNCPIVVLGGAATAASARAAAR